MPELSSPIISGLGPRELGFTPPPWADQIANGMAAEGEFLSVVSDGDGRDVKLYRRLEPPLTWWLLWSLSGGILATHLRVEDGVERVGAITAAISIDETAPTPFLLLSDPLRRGVSSFPGYQETATYFSEEAKSGITLLRPGFLGLGETVAADVGPTFVARGGTAFGLEVQVRAPALEDATNVLSQLIADLVAL